MRTRPKSRASPRRTILRRGGVVGSGFLAALLLVVVALPARAAKIGEVTENSVWEQVARFLTFQDPTIRLAVTGAALMGISCGILGTFLVVRRLALVGDTLSHAVLPGVAAGFLWGQTKNPVSIFVGAVVAGLLGTMVASAIRRTTRLKEDTALGLVLAGFYAVGICLVTMIQRLPTGNKSGIDKFLFGQAAAISSGDLGLMAVVTLVVLVVVVVFYKELLVTSFDPAFARSTGFPVRLIQDGLMLLLAFAVVSALQAVGVVLVSAMLITPAASAYLLTDRLRRMLVISSTIGSVTGVAGCFLSFLGNSLPTGPMMVLATSVVFAGAFCFAPRHGLVIRWAKARGRQRRVGRENTLKAFYHILENRRFERESVTLRELATHRRETLDDADREAKALVRHGLAVLEDDGQLLRLTGDGKKRSAELVRNHRLWELYLTNAVRYAADHVHDDAEKIEHVLGEEVVWELERRLNFADTDPHGKPIPTPEEWLARPSRGALDLSAREGGAS
jgi:ABC-type Mn2+/Zn2+ transport system permease subunit/Mn-dependent DtxR family transcriptional regulator